MACWEVWKPVDPNQQLYCPKCWNQEIERIPCESSPDRKDGCHLAKFEESIVTMGVGDILTEIQYIENLQSMKLPVSASDIRADVFGAMIVLSEEKERYRREHKGESPKG